MKEKNILTEGRIIKVLVSLALPIMGTSFVQTAYNLTNAKAPRIIKPSTL